MRIKVSIKLFGAFFLILAIVVGAMFFSRYLFARNFENYIHQMEMERLQRLIPALQAAYRVHHNWMDIKQDRMRWEHIMRDMLSIDRHDPPPPRDQQGPPGGPPRVVLMDANRQPVVGMPGPGEQDQLVSIHVDGQIVGWLGLNLIIGPIVLDENTRQVTIEGSPLILTPSEFGLLNVMIASPERVFLAVSCWTGLKGTTVPSTAILKIYAKKSPNCCRARTLFKPFTVWDTSLVFDLLRANLLKSIQTKPH